MLEEMTVFTMHYCFRIVQVTLLCAEEAHGKCFLFIQNTDFGEFSMDFSQEFGNHISHKYKNSSLPLPRIGPCDSGYIKRGCL